MTNGLYDRWEDMTARVMLRMQPSLYDLLKAEAKTQHGSRWGKPQVARLMRRYLREGLERSHAAREAAEQGEANGNE